MAPVYPSSTQVGSWASLPKASAQSSQSPLAPFDEHQKGHAGSAYRALSHTHWLIVSLPVSRLAELSAFAGARSVTNSVHRFGSTRRAAQSRTNQSLRQFGSCRVHLDRLSSSLINCINKCSQARTSYCQIVTRSAA